MTSEDEYYVIPESGELIGPIGVDVITHMVQQYSIGPSSAVRKGESGKWITMRELAHEIGIELPSDDEWAVEKKTVRSNERKNLLLGGGCVLAVFWIGMIALGLGFIATPMIILAILFLAISKLFDLITGKQVLAAPMWTDIREKPSTEQIWQFLAFVIALLLLATYYVLKFLPE